MAFWENAWIIFFQEMGLSKCYMSMKYFLENVAGSFQTVFSAICVNSMQRECARLWFKSRY